MYIKKQEVKWSDVDANNHMRNTAYSDFATHTRFSFFMDHQLGPEYLHQHRIGPVIIREELRYLREVKLMETTQVSCELLRATPDFMRFDFMQQLWRQDGKLAARIELDAIWLHLDSRKPRAPEGELLEICKQIPRSASVDWFEGRPAID